VRKGGSAALAGARRSGVVRSEISFDTTRPLRRQRLVERIHLLGPRVLFELIEEIDRAHGLGTDLDRRLARYAAIDPAQLAVTGGDRFPAPALRLVR
jgi:hypothetical protein